jgi:hypothetical protein
MSAAQARPSEEILRKLSPDLVAPTVALLAHRNCPSSGKCIGSEAGNVYELFYGRTVGYSDPDARTHDLEQHWDAVVKRDDFREIGDPKDGCAGFTLTPRTYRPS